MRWRSCFTLVLLGSSAPALASPALSGLYQVGGVGLVEFSVEDGAQVGRWRKGGECEYQAYQPVVRGQFEGTVFVGTVQLCQSGAGCPAVQDFPFLGFWHADQLIGWVRFEAGCRSPATDDRRLLFRQATVEEKSDLGTTASALAVARRRPVDAVENAIQEIEAGRRSLEAGAYQEAARHFELAVDSDPDNYVALLGLGTAQVKLRRPASAVQTLQRARARGKAAGPSFLAQVHYNLACAHAQQRDTRTALRALGEVARLGDASMVDELEHDPDLEPVRDDPEFRRIAASLRAREKAPR